MATIAACLIAVAFTGCKGGGGEENPEGDGTGESAEAAPPAPPKPPPATSVKLAKKWPAGQAVTFSKNVLINRHVLTPTPAAIVDERETSYSISFGGGGGGGADSGGMDGGTDGGAAAAPVSLAQTVDMQIVGQKIEKTANGNKFISFTGNSGGGDGGGGGDEMMEEDPTLAGGDAGGGGAAPPHPLANSVKASLGSAVKLTFGADGAVTNVTGLSGAGGVHSKVLRGVPRGLFPLVGGMFSQTVFQEAPMFHSLLNGAEVKKDMPWYSTEKGMLLLNWQQTFNFTNTFTGMEDWNGKKVAAFDIAGGISGSTTKPMSVRISPGGSFTGKALYDPENGILVQRSITGSFLATEAGSMSVSNAFTQTFKVSSIAMAEGADMQ